MDELAFYQNSTPVSALTWMTSAAVLRNLQYQHWLKLRHERWSFL
jgi:hypothetical protein